MAASVAKNEAAGFFEHGGRLDLARKIYPGAPLPWIDLSTCVSPWAYPVPPVDAEAWQRLPEPDALVSLLAAARKAYRVPDAASVVALPGTEIGLNTLPWLFREPKRVEVLGPTYSSHIKAWEAAGHSVTPINALSEAGRAAIVAVVNPNNPTGTVLTQAELAAIVGPIRRKGGLLVIDEAFADEDDSLSILPNVARLDHTLVFRSLGKFYGAAGVRLGFAMTSHPVAERLKGAMGAWPISAAALALGEAALSDENWKLEHRKKLKAAAADLDSLLTEAGLQLLGGTSLFRFAAMDASEEVFAKLAWHGILTRPFAHRSALRFGLPKDATEAARLREALRAAS